MGTIWLAFDVAKSLHRLLCTLEGSELHYISHRDRCVLRGTGHGYLCYMPRRIFEDIICWPKVGGVGLSGWLDRIRPA